MRDDESQINQFWVRKLLRVTPHYIKGISLDQELALVAGIPGILAFIGNNQGEEGYCAMIIRHDIGDLTPQSQFLDLRR
jgi:hypothetical protein